MARLDQTLLRKLAAKLGNKNLQYLREQISRRASREGISSEAVLVQWSRQQGIGTAAYLNRLPASVRDEARRDPNERQAGVQSRSPGRPPARRSAAPIAIGKVVDLLVEDEELRDRCRDLLSARRHHDRVVREATTVLDDRLKRLSGIKNMNPGALVGKVLNPDPTQAVIEVSADPEEQRGLHAICSGIMAAFRNKAHHALSNSFTQRDALRFCAFIDTLLTIIGKGTVHTSRL